MRRATLLLAMGFVCSRTTIAAAQREPRAPRVNYGERGQFSFGIDYGSVDSDLLSAYLNANDAAIDANYVEPPLGGVGVNLRLLLPTPMLNRRLKLGGEFGLFVVAEGLDSHSLQCIGPGTCPLGPPDRIGYYATALTDIRLLGSLQTVVHAEVGVGAAFYVLDRDYSMPSAPPRPSSAEVLVSGRLIAAIPVWRSGSLDPFVDALHTFGDTRATTFRFGIGMSFLWGGS